MSRDDRIRAITVLRKKIGIVILAQRTLTLATIYMFLCGTGILISRITLGRVPVSVLYCMLLCIPFCIILLFVERKKIPSLSACRALMDYYNEYGGILMAAESMNIKEWEKHLAPLEMPCIIWRGRKACVLFGAALLFVCISFFVPQGPFTHAVNLPFEVDEIIDEMASTIEILKHEECIEPHKAERLQEKLEKLGNEASGEDPVKTWEALDHINKTLSALAEDMAEDTIASMEQVNQMEAFVEALPESAHVAEEFSRMLDTMKVSDQKILDNLKNTSLTDNRRAVTDALRQCKGGLLERMKKMHDFRLISDYAMEEALKEVRHSDDELASFLKENEMTAEIMKGCSFGQGGINRGPGYAPMTWTSKSSEEGIDFEEEMLPPPQISSMEKSELIGISYSEPEENGQMSTEVQGALGMATPDGGSAHHYPILPMHKRAVSRYFQNYKPEDK